MELPTNLYNHSQNDPITLNNMISMIAKLNSVKSDALASSWASCENLYLPQDYENSPSHKVAMEAGFRLKQFGKPDTWLHWIGSGLLKFFLPKLSLDDHYLWLSKLQFIWLNIKEKINSATIHHLNINESYFLSSLRYCVARLYLNPDFLNLEDRSFFFDIHSILVQTGVWQLGCLDQYDKDLMQKISKSVDSIKPGTPFNQETLFPCLALMLYRRPSRLAKNLDSDRMFSLSCKKLLPLHPAYKDAPLYDRKIVQMNYPEEYYLWYIENFETLSSYRNKHQGETCFLISNGPSIKHMDLSKLRNRVTFGSNRIYLLFDQLGFETSYYLVADDHWGINSSREISSLMMPKFISMFARKYIEYDPSISFLRPEYDIKNFITDIREGISIYYTVNYMAMQIAYYMGFKKVILIGADHSWDESGGSDPTKDINHFHEAYKPGPYKGNKKGMEMVYQIAKAKFEADGREILDATVGGKLQVFRKIDFQDALNL